MLRPRSLACVARHAHCVLASLVTLVHDRQTGPVLNPLRSEGEAFRLLLYVIAVFAVIVVLIVARALL